MAQRYEYQDIDGHVILLFVHPAVKAVNCFKSFSSFNPSPEYQKTKSADYQKSNQHLVIYLLTVFMQPLL